MSGIFVPPVADDSGAFVTFVLSLAPAGKSSPPLLGLPKPSASPTRDSLIPCLKLAPRKSGFETAFSLAVATLAAALPTSIGIPASIYPLFYSAEKRLKCQINSPPISA